MHSLKSCKVLEFIVRVVAATQTKTDCLLHPPPPPTHTLPYLLLHCCTLCTYFSTFCIFSTIGNMAKSMRTFVSFRFSLITSHTLAKATTASTRPSNLGQPGQESIGICIMYIQYIDIYIQYLYGTCLHTYNLYSSIQYMLTCLTCSETIATLTSYPPPSPHKLSCTSVSPSLPPLFPILHLLCYSLVLLRTLFRYYFKFALGIFHILCWLIQLGAKFNSMKINRSYLTDTVTLFIHMYNTY